MPNAPGGSVTGYGFCLPVGPTATILRAAGTTTSPVFVAAAETGPASAGNTDSTLTCTPGAAPWADAAASDATTTQTAASNAAARDFFMEALLSMFWHRRRVPGRSRRPFGVAADYPSRESEVQLRWP